MENIDMKLSGDTLTITVDMSVKGTPSKSQKSMVIASTRGNVKVPDSDAIIGMTVYRKIG